ncbi:MAG: CubicO group peptidase (beta-lactamase class C family) [Flavobacteriales bacterium]|jgi:CubicO group peptidase (beta-lactamase class C family)
MDVRTTSKIILSKWLEHTIYSSEEAEECFFSMLSVLSSIVNPLEQTFLLILNLLKKPESNTQPQNMMMKLRYLLGFLCIACSSSTDDVTVAAENDPIDTSETSDDSDTSGDRIYFPPLDASTWETVSPTDLNWDTAAIADLETYLNLTNTKAFIILKDGKIALESYFQTTDATTNHPWFSAGKTLTAYTIGIAQQEGFLSIEDASSEYLGTEWTAMTSAQESAIQIQNQLSMTSGGDFTRLDLYCTDPDCLAFRSPAGDEWFYYNAFYTLLQDVVSTATNQEYNDYFNAKIRNPIGMDGAWVPLGYNRFYFSTARSMARFGLLNLNQGVWESQEILNPTFFDAMTGSSQDLNPAYGYLWWLNGKDSYRLPGATESFSGLLIPNAPDDLIAGLGANDKKLYVVPSQGLVVIRLGDAAETDLLGPSGYDNALWEKIMALIN